MVAVTAGALILDLAMQIITTTMCASVVRRKHWR